MISSEDYDATIEAMAKAMYKSCQPWASWENPKRMVGDASPY